MFLSSSDKVSRVPRKGTDSLADLYLATSQEVIESAEAPLFWKTKFLLRSRSGIEEGTGMSEKTASMAFDFKIFPLPELSTDLN